MAEHSNPLRSTVGPILALSSDGQIMKANLQARRAFGRQEALENQDLGVLLAHAMMRHGLPAERLQVLLRGDDGEQHEVLLVLGDEERARLRVVQSSNAVSTGEPPQIDQGAATNAADFIAHELRNNLSITLGLAQLLEANFDTIAPDDRRAAVRGIQVESHHALQVLEGLLKIVESRRKPEIATASVPVHTVLRQVVTDHRRRYPEREIEVSGDEPVFATGNSTWMQVAIANLLSNAEKVTPNDQSIQINVYQSGDRVIILVLDQGKALAAPVYEELWDIYMKGAPQGLEVSGSGIGLSLCKELVQAMGGRVWAGPRSHQGSAFAISLRGVLDDGIIGDLNAAA